MNARSMFRLSTPAWVMLALLGADARDCDFDWPDFVDPCPAVACPGDVFVDDQGCAQCQSNCTSVEDCGSEEVCSVAFGDCFSGCGGGDVDCAAVCGGWCIPAGVVCITDADCGDGVCIVGALPPSDDSLRAPAETLDRGRCEPVAPQTCETVSCGGDFHCEDFQDVATCVANVTPCIADSDCGAEQMCATTEICPPCVYEEPACAAPCMIEGECVPR
jgi:hypothetical protein